MALIADWNTEPVLMTNSHCSMNNFWLDYGTTAQPFVNYPWVEPNVPQCGNERFDWGGYRCGPVWGRKSCRFADISLYSIIGATASHPDSIAVLGRIAAMSIRNLGWNVANQIVLPSIGISQTGTPHLRVTNRQGYPVQGEALDKIGSSTGWTWGNVSETCVDVGTAVVPGGHVSGDERFLCQDRASLGATGGVSGSPVFKPGGPGPSDVPFYGVSWGSDPWPSTRTTFSSWSGIFSELGSTWKVCIAGGPNAC
jgi:hypothetical protein